MPRESRQLLLRACSAARKQRSQDTPRIPVAQSHSDLGYGPESERPQAEHMLTYYFLKTKTAAATAASLVAATAMRRRSSLRC